MLSLPPLALLIKLDLAALRLLLEAVLALCCLAFTLASRRQLRFDGSSTLAETRETSQLVELPGELPDLSGGILSLPSGGLSVDERVLDLRVARQGGDHPRRLVTLSPGVLQLHGGLVALHPGFVKPGALSDKPLALNERLTP